ncbi:CaiB/BaiF CoA transferase family protein [Hyphobacterium marinum]|uniref:CaiB/BaiF CoA-transferase family protein n=1 Tax=Hyphobacterium marinum TaxID=3116574 RepID=A0ABU7LVX8_9PROT|nr:CaiB/BaiF CoA-transferase family protein [Hyphobacterium sp. Y6023]MEE2565706.1 CaiB/BaiF CoA-transferase family protein [Hyphobacterium sp. Y6023]
MSGPLHGINVIELAGIGPAPMAGQLLADLGADVISIDRHAEARLPERPKDANRRGKRSIVLDLKNSDAVDVVRKLAAGADLFFEGFRPGVAERLGLGPDVLLKANPKLVYGRLTGWGQTGPLSQRAGHDINYIALSGALGTMGGKDQPVPPLNLVGDYAGGSLFLIVGMLAALVRARETGEGQVVDAAMTDGSAAIMSLIHSLLASGLWSDGRETNLLDGSAPFYRTYVTADGGHMAVGAIEPQFFAALLDGLGVDSSEAAHQYDREHWPRLTEVFAARFAARKRDDWTQHFSATDACVTPVLSLKEAPLHAHNTARRTFETRDGFVQPAPAPRFSQTPAETGRGPFFAGEDTREILAQAGFDDAGITSLINSGAAAESS